MDVKIDVRPLISNEDSNKVEELQSIVWPGSETDVVPGHMLLAIARNGGLLLGAFHEKELVGFLLGFIGTDEESSDRPAMAKLKHHSHMMGVHPEYRDEGIGVAIKLAQRDFAAKQGIRLITWTFDPLQSRNAYLNIHRLGAVCRRYHREAYGEMRDGLNVGYPSDRFEIEWWITSPRVQTRVSGSRGTLDLANYLGGGAVKINPAILGSDKVLRPSKETLPLKDTIILIEIPSNISELKEKDPELANEWRMHTRELFEEAFRKSFIVTDFIYLKGESYPRSYYVLSYGESRLG
jgi:predicted GNAT superfamily acetyltransferase